MSKEVVFDSEARERLMRGVDTLANSIRVTLGAKGRNVMIGEGMYAASVTNDGVTVARSIELDDAIENMGAYFLKEAAAKTEEQAGDGTSTATILTQSMLRTGMKYLAAGANPMDLKRGMQLISSKLIDKIDEIATKIEYDSEEVKHVATVSANNDEELGGLIADAFKKVGKNGIVAVMESGSLETEVNVVEGMELDRGYVDRAFCTNGEKMTADLEDCYILITDAKIFSFRQLLPILEKVNKKNKPVVIISDEIDQLVLPTIILNHSQSLINVACVKAPGFGNERDDILEDIATVTGGTIISEARGMKLEEAEIDMLGEASKVYISIDKTVIIDGFGETEAIEDRMTQIKEFADKEKDDYKKSKLIERLSKIAGGIGVIYVGGHTDTEAEERKLRVDDSVAATKAAIEDGIVPGGGVTLALAGHTVDLFNLKFPNRDQELGADIVLSALKEPLSQIVKNAGQSPDVILNEVLKQKDGTGYNVNTDEYEDMIKAGIVDPAKVTKSALRNAVSISSMVITTEVVVANKKQN
jgi:chaperonin GroEL